MYVKVASIICLLEYVHNFPSPYKRALSKVLFERFDRPSESNIALTVPRRACLDIMQVIEQQKVSCILSAIIYLAHRIDCFLKHMPKCMKNEFVEANM